MTIKRGELLTAASGAFAFMEVTSGEIAYQFPKGLARDGPGAGWFPEMKSPRLRPLAEDFESVAYSYQREPHAPFPQLPPLARRWARRRYAGGSLQL